MSDHRSDVVERVMARFGVLASGAGAGAGEAKSGASVVRVRTGSGLRAYLKVTPADSTGREYLTKAARRELRFYNDVAPMIPVSTPRLLASEDGPDGVVLLLGDCGETVEVGGWPPEMWVRIAAQLAYLHNADLPSGDDWIEADTLLAIMNTADRDEVANSWNGVLSVSRRTLQSVQEFRTARSAEPGILTHGDFHAGNIPFNVDAPHVCDWQEAAIGHPESDIAFLSSRATPAGVTIPDAMVTEYLDRAGGVFTRFEKALVAEELAIFLFLWPPFLPSQSPASLARIRNRVEYLTVRWAQLERQHERGS